jgi:predicted PurR-regulated permease PerM
MLASNKKPLLIVLFLLLALRFVMVPVIDWQQEQLDEIAAKQTKVEKADSVIARFPQLQQALEQVQQNNKQQLANYYGHESANSLKLQLQQELEALFLKHKIKVINFSWVAEIENPITEFRAKISYEGKTDDFAKLQLAIARYPKRINIAEWTSYINKMAENSLGDASGTILLTTYNVIPLKALNNAE